MEEKRIKIDDFKNALLQIDRMKATEIFENLYVNKGNFGDLEFLTMETLESIGFDWENGLLSLSQVYMSGVICEELIQKYIPKYNETYKSSPKMGIGVLLDHHALGKRIVYSVLRAGGYDLIDFGQGLSVEDFINETMENELDILLISTLMLSSAWKIKDVVEGLRERGSSVKVIVGGPAFRIDTSLWQKVNADADGKNGTEVTSIVKNLSEKGESL